MRQKMEKIDPFKKIRCYLQTKSSRIFPFQVLKKSISSDPKLQRGEQVVVHDFQDNQTSRYRHDHVDTDMFLYVNFSSSSQFESQAFKVIKSTSKIMSAPTKSFWNRHDFDIQNLVSFAVLLHLVIFDGFQVISV